MGFDAVALGAAVFIGDERNRSDLYWFKSKRYDHRRLMHFVLFCVIFSAQRES